jgi:hypothetical protein
MANLLKYSQHLLHNTTATQTALLPWYRSAETVFSEKASTISIYGSSPIINFAISSTGGPFAAQIQQTLGSITGGTTLTLSATVKYVDSQFVGLGFYDSSWRIQNFDLINNTVGTSMADIVNAAIEILSGGIVRIKATFTVPATGTIIIGLSHSESLTITTPASSFGLIVNLDVHGLQCETGTIANIYEGTTWGTTTQVVAMASSSIKNWSDKTSWQSGELPLPGDSVNLNTGAGTSSNYPRLIVDILYITVKSITFIANQSIRLVIISPETVINGSIYSSNNGYYQMISWESSGGFTINGNIYIYGLQSNWTTSNFSQGLIIRTGSFVSGTLTINGTITGSATSGNIPSGFFITQNTNSASLDTLIINGPVNITNSVTYSYPFIYTGSTSLKIIFNDLLSIFGDAYSDAYFIRRQSPSVVLQIEVNNGLNNMSGGNGIFPLFYENSTYASGIKTANGISNRIIFRGESNIRTYNSSIIVSYITAIEVIGTLKIQGGSSQAITLAGEAVMNSPLGTIKNISALGVSPIGISNSKEHFIGTIDGSFPTAQSASIYAIVQWTPVTPVSTAKMTISKIISGGTVGVSITGSLNPVTLNVSLIETVDPAVETLSYYMPAVSSSNKYAKTVIGNVIIHKYGSWIISGRFELLNSSSTIVIESDTNPAKTIGTIPDLIIPSPSDVRKNIEVGIAGQYGSLVLPQAANVQSGVVYDNGTTGTLLGLTSTDLIPIAKEATLTSIKANTDQFTFGVGGVNATASATDYTSRFNNLDAAIVAIPTLSYSARFDNLDTAIIGIQTDTTSIKTTTATTSIAVSSVKSQTDQLVFLPGGVKATTGVTGGETTLTAGLAELDTLLDTVKAKTDTLTFTTGVNATSIIP